MKSLAVGNSRQKNYNEILMKLKIDDSVQEFQKKGKLIICLIEFRPLQEIECVMAAILKSYKPSEIGVAMMYGNTNKTLVESTFKNWKNMVLIHKNIDNVDRGIYSALLKSPEFYENFTRWSHILIYQTDALLFRKIDDIYFNYDYIGAPWIQTNQWCKYNAGNGGFSLRNVKSCIKACEPNRNKAYMQIHRGNEDGFFCRQDSFVYPNCNTTLHKMFSIERLPCANPIGCHQVYHCFAMNNEMWNKFLEYMRMTLLNGKKPEIDMGELLELEKKEVTQMKQDQETKKKQEETAKIAEKVHQTEIITKMQGIQIKELCGVEQQFGSFTLKLTNTHQNRWVINCANDYEILFCRNADPSSVVETHKRLSYVEACIHKKAEGCYYLRRDNFIYIVFYPGFPNGGQSWADINAEGNFRNCRNLPKNGAIILKSFWDKQVVPTINKKKYNIDHIKHNILAFDLFTGVGFYNQLFSLEQAVYMAHISKRYLILNIQHPLVACGKPNRDYGLLTEIVGERFKKFLLGCESRNYGNFVDPADCILKITEKMSSCVFIDNKLDGPDYKKDLNEFLHHKRGLPYNSFKDLFDNGKKIVYYNKSNASRFFYNFYTTKENYCIMSKIASTLSGYNDFLSDLAMKFLDNKVYQHPVFKNQSVENKDKKFYAVHIRMGDWHKSANQNENKRIIDNLSSWMERNNKQDWPIFIMTDKKENSVFDRLNKFKIVFTDTLITSEITSQLKTRYKNTVVVEFLLQKYILDKAVRFFGSQGSTVSVHVNYMMHINGKPSNNIVNSTCNSFDKENMEYKDMNDAKYTWKRKNLNGGHPLCWAFFSPDNINVGAHPGAHPDANDKSNIVLDIQEVDDKSVNKSPDKPVENKPEPFEKHSDPYISVDNWVTLADVVIESTYKRRPNYDYKAELNTAFNSKKNPVIMVKTDLLPNYIDTLNKLDRPFTLITTSNDDHCPPYLEFPPDEAKYPKLKEKTDLLLQSPNLLMWYAKNPCIVHNKLKPYPIGPKWQWRTTQFYGENKYENLQIYKSFGTDPEKMFRDHTLKKDLVFLNFSQTTNNPLYRPHKSCRHNVKSDLLKRGFKWNENRPFKDYMQTMTTYKFALAPPGRGIDTHRCWEALMVGTIPIVMSSSINELYQDLPVVVVEDWNVVTEEFLHKKYDEIQKSTYDFKKVYCDYWVKKITEKRE